MATPTPRTPSSATPAVVLAALLVVSVAIGAIVGGVPGWLPLLLVIGGSAAWRAADTHIGGVVERPSRPKTPGPKAGGHSPGTR